MPIDPDFPKNHQTIGKHKHTDGEHFHFVWAQADQMLKHQQTLKFKKHIKPEERSMFLWGFMELLGYYVIKPKSSFCRIFFLLVFIDLA